MKEIKIDQCHDIRIGVEDGKVYLAMEDPENFVTTSLDAKTAEQIIDALTMACVSLKSIDKKPKQSKAMKQCEVILKMLQEHSRVTADFMTPPLGAAYRPRISDLRKKGFDIQAKRIRTGSWKYTLIGNAQDNTQFLQQQSPQQ